MRNKNANIIKQDTLVKRNDREKLLSQKAVLLWFTGLPGSGKTTIAKLLEREIYNKGYPMKKSLFVPIFVACLLLIPASAQAVVLAEYAVGSPSNPGASGTAAPAAYNSIDLDYYYVSISLIILDK